MEPVTKNRIIPGHQRMNTTCLATTVPQLTDMFMACHALRLVLCHVAVRSDVECWDLFCSGVPYYVVCFVPLHYDMFGCVLFPFHPFPLLFCPCLPLPCSVLPSSTLLSLSSLFSCCLPFSSVLLILFSSF